MKLINAKEALEISLKNEKNHIDEIMEEIRNEAMKGLTKALVTNHSEKDIKTLQDLGFKTIIKAFNDGIYLKIAWYK